MSTVSTVSINHEAGWRKDFTNAMIGWAVISKVFLVLQALKIYHSQSAAGVSFYAYVIYLVGAVVWFVYGAYVLVPRSTSLILSGILAFLGGVVILIGIFLYGEGAGAL
jgi:uncharacterized protein with PQ loop repeat